MDIYERAMESYNNLKPVPGIIDWPMMKIEHVLAANVAYVIALVVLTKFMQSREPFKLTGFMSMSERLLNQVLTRFKGSITSLVCFWLVPWCTAFGIVSP